MAAATAIQSHTANIVVPSIHLGSFSPYPSMSNDLKQPLRFPDENTIPVFKDQTAQSSYPPQRNPTQRRSQNTPYPLSPPHPYALSRTPPLPSPAQPRTPPPPGTPYASSGQSPALPIQPPNSPAQIPGPPREVCVECMMRDEDMADVDVTGPGVWDRESDVYYRELCQREEEEERDREQSLHPNSSSGLSSSAGCSRPRAHGAKLTEGNLKVWLSLNPREPASRQQTLSKYLDTQNDLLIAENKARLQAMQESRQLDNKMRDAYSELRRSAYDLGANASALDEGGVKIRSPNAGSFGDDLRNHSHKRDTTLLENGMIVERVDVRKEEARVRKEERRTRKASRDSLSVVDYRDRERDATSLYSFQAAEGPGSLRAIPPYDSSISIGLGASRSVRSMYTTPSSSWQPPVPNRPMSMAPGLASQTSLDSTASPRRRLFGMRQWSGYFGSNASLVQSGSMIDMHIGLDQEKQSAQTPQVDIGSNAPSLREAWPRLEDGTSGRPSLDRGSSSIHVKKKKGRGLGRLWKIITGAPNKKPELPDLDHCPPREEEEEDLPLTPPPPLSYLVNRGSSQSERSMNMMGKGRHVSMPSLTLSNGAHHPRSNSTPNGAGVSLSSPSDKSSLLPSPTEVRFPYRDSSGDEREDGAYEEDAGLAVKRKPSITGSPPLPFVLNISDPEFQVSPPAPMAVPNPPLPHKTRITPLSSSLVATLVPPLSPVRPMSVLSLDKSLPPLPSGERESSTPSPLPGLPRSAAAPGTTLPMASFGRHPQREPSAPNPGFRYEDAARRQSFNGLTSRPDLPRGAGPGITPGMRYDDFGASRHSVAVFEPVPSVTSQRKSRFGIGTLLGRKEKGSGGHRQHASMTTSTLRTRDISFDAFAAQAPAPSFSERSLSQHGLSMPSRRPLDDIVPQEPDFVAYRYPSKDERLDLSRN